MSLIVALLASMIPPPPIPGPPQPAKFPEYMATCHVVGIEGVLHTGSLRISGNEPNRTVELNFPSSTAWPRKYRGSPQTYATLFVSDGTYKYSDYLTYREIGETYLVLIEGLGPTPDVFSLEIKKPPRSPVFEDPGLVGLCRHESAIESSPK